MTLKMDFRMDYGPHLRHTNCQILSHHKLEHRQRYTKRGGYIRHRAKQTQTEA